jgi:hypothetical protein
MGVHESNQGRDGKNNELSSKKREDAEEALQKLPLRFRPDQAPSTRRDSGSGRELRRKLHYDGIQEISPVFTSMQCYSGI